jgi:hypothetical protein
LLLISISFPFAVKEIFSEIFPQKLKGRTDDPSKAVFKSSNPKPKIIESNQKNKVKVAAIDQKVLENKNKKNELYCFLNQSKSLRFKIKNNNS